MSSHERKALSPKDGLPLVASPASSQKSRTLKNHNTQITYTRSNLRFHQSTKAWELKYTFLNVETNLFDHVGQGLIAVDSDHRHVREIVAEIDTELLPSLHPAWLPKLYGLLTWSLWFPLTRCQGPSVCVLSSPGWFALSQSGSTSDQLLDLACRASILTR